VAGPFLDAQAVAALSARNVETFAAVPGDHSHAADGIAQTLETKELIVAEVTGVLL
jgi:hypothetical protein